MPLWLLVRPAGQPLTAPSTQPAHARTPLQRLQLQLPLCLACLHVRLPVACLAAQRAHLLLEPLRACSCRAHLSGGAGGQGGHHHPIGKGGGWRLSCRRLATQAHGAVKARTPTPAPHAHLVLLRLPRSTQLCLELGNLRCQGGVFTHQNRLTPCSLPPAASLGAVAILSRLTLQFTCLHC